MNQTVKKLYYQYWFQPTTKNTSKRPLNITIKTRKKKWSHLSHTNVWHLIPSYIWLYRLMSHKLVLDQENQKKGDNVLLRFQLYPFQHIVIEHYSASHIVTKQRLLNYLLGAPLKYMHLIVSHQTAQIESNFPLSMKDSFEVLQKRQEHKLWSNRNSCRLEESVCFLSASQVFWRTWEYICSFLSIVPKNKQKKR